MSIGTDCTSKKPRCPGAKPGVVEHQETLATGSVDFGSLDVSAFHLVDQGVNPLRSTQQDIEDLRTEQRPVPAPAGEQDIRHTTVIEVAHPTSDCDLQCTR